jgi:hypothetical protein
MVEILRRPLEYHGVEGRGAIMSEQQYFELPEFSAILTFIDAIFAEINMGLFIYHVEDPQDIRTARLIYANKQASLFTGTDLGRQVGKLIFDAFPYLVDTEIPRLYQEVVREKKAHHVGIIEYEDENVRRGRYSTRAFPMPNDCIGILFDTVPDEGASS